MKRCPKCGGTKFNVTYHVTQTVQVDGDGSFIKELTSCDEVTHKADDGDLWTCADCGYEAPGNEFNVKGGDVIKDVKEAAHTLCRVRAGNRTKGEKLLEECANAKDYTSVAIYDNGEIVAVQRPDQVFLDCTETFALIRKLPVSPTYSMSYGLTVDTTRNVDYDLGRITELSTWQALVKNHFTDALADKDENALVFTLSSLRPIPSEVFDLLYAAYPDTPLEGILYKCKRIEAVKWAVEHGADRFYDGYKYPMKEILAWAPRCPDAKEIFKFLYGEVLEDPK